MPAVQLQAVTLMPADYKNELIKRLQAQLALQTKASDEEAARREVGGCAGWGVGAGQVGAQAQVGCRH
jgi:hypothetical protein